MELMKPPPRSTNITHIALSGRRSRFWYLPKVHKTHRNKPRGIIIMALTIMNMNKTTSNLLQNSWKMQQIQRELYECGKQLCFGYNQMGRGGTLYRLACTLSTIIVVLKKLEISKEALEVALALKHSQVKAQSCHCEAKPTTLKHLRAWPHQGVLDQVWIWTGPTRKVWTG